MIDNDHHLPTPCAVNPHFGVPACQQPTIALDVRVHLRVLATTSLAPLTCDVLG
jgi:hypothetical protein